MNLQFKFPLMPVDELIPGQSTEGTLSLSWLGLTFGWFWIKVGNQELFRHSQMFEEHTGYASALPYDDYQISRCWEDLLDMLPTPGEDHHVIARIALLGVQSNASDYVMQQSILFL